MATQPAAGKLKVTIDGTELPDDIDRLLTSAVVDDHLLLPDVFILTFIDPDRIVLKKTNAKIGSKVKLTVVSDVAPKGDLLLSGELTALEFEHDGTGTYIVLRGYDNSHRLSRGTVTESYQGMTYSDVAKKVAKRHDLQPGQIDPVSNVQPHVAQGNMNDWQFLQLLARDVGFEVTVVDDKLNFRKPESSADGPDKGTLIDTSNPLQLTLGAHLLSIRSVVTAAEQVDEVEVRGWDPEAKKEVKATSKAASTSASIGSKPGDLAGNFGNKKMVGTSVPHGTSADVEAAAKAMAEHIGGSFAEVEGLARGNSKLKAGKAISLSLLGDPFDGKYTLTSTRHQFTHHDGYTTAFTVSGRNQRSLLGLMSGGGGTNQSNGIGGVVPAIVTEVKDPKDLGRVKVKFPWLSDDFASHWVRMVQFGAGKDRGALFLPEVNDEVLVAFEQGDIRRPYVLGGLYNGVDKPNLGKDLFDGSSGAVKRRGIISKRGHSLVFFDDASHDGVSLMTGGKSLKVSLNKSDTTIKITSGGQVKIDAKKDIAIKSSSGNLTVEAKQKLTLKGETVEVSGTSIKLGG